MTPRLTVIVAFHNLAGLVSETVASLERAIDDRIELLLIDDASTDATADLLDQALPRLGRARLHRNPRNLGLSGVRNLGVSLSDTEYLTFFDGDDYVTRGYFPALLTAITELKCDFVRTDHIETIGRDRVVKRIPDGHRDGRVGAPREAILPADQRTAIDYPYAWAGAYHRSLADAGLLRFPDLRTAEDRPWIWQLHLGAESFSIPDLVGVHYRRERPGSLTGLATSTQLDFVRSMQLVVETVERDAERDRFLPKALRRWCDLTLHHLGRLERFTPPVRRTFQQLMADGLAHAPQEVLQATLDQMAPEQVERLMRLITKHSSAEWNPR